MTTTEHTGGRQGENVKHVLAEDVTGTGTEVKGSTMPKIRGLEILKEGIYEVDPEKTVHDMFVVIKGMESQLERVLSINALLEKDLNDSKRMISELKTAKGRLEEKASRMEDEIPSKRELQIEIDHLIDERNLAQVTIRDLRSSIENTQLKLIHFQKQVARLGEEKRDALAEVSFLESRVTNAAQKIREAEVQINSLRGENLALKEKGKGLEKELTETLDEKYRLIKELKETKDAMSEIRSALTNKKLRAKKSFYMGQEEKDK